MTAMTVAIICCTMLLGIPTFGMFVGWIRNWERDSWGHSQSPKARLAITQAKIDKNGDVARLLWHKGRRRDGSPACASDCFIHGSIYDPQRKFDTCTSKK